MNIMITPFSSIQQLWSCKKMWLPRQTQESNKIYKRIYQKQEFPMLSF